MFTYRLPLAVSALVFVGLTAGCAGQEDGAPANADSDLVDQASPDIATLTVHIRESINGNGQPGFQPSECAAASAAGSFSMDCTTAMEQRFSLPALHQIMVGTSQFFCSAMHVETVSRQAALDASDGIGFYYRGAGDGSPERFIPKAALRKVRDVTLRNGEPGVVHEFVGLAGCWQGSATSSMMKTYDLKPYMRFTSSETYKNWEAGGNHSFHGTSVHMDRTGELLR